MDTVAEIVQVIQDAGGVAVAYGGETSYGLLDGPGLEVLTEDGRPGVLDADPVVGIATGVFSTPLEMNAAITVDGQPRRIRKHLPIDDGKLTRIWLREA